MTAGVHDWLPDEALTGEIVHSAAEAVATEWSARWLSRGGLGVVGVEMRRDVRARAADGAWRQLGAVAVSSPRAVVSGLLEHALDLKWEGLAPSGADRRVVSAFAERLVDDLASHLGQAFGSAPHDPLASPAAPDASDGASVHFHIGEGRNRLIAVAVPKATIVAFVKRRLKRGAAKSAPMNGLNQALAATPAALEAVLGKARMSLSDLSSLAPGDVVVLDRPLNGGALITQPNSDAVLANGKLSQVDGRIALTLKARPN